jgi:hypothetical protein
MIGRVVVMRGWMERCVPLANHDMKPPKVNHLKFISLSIHIRYGRKA